MGLPWSAKFTTVNASGLTFSSIAYYPPSFSELRRAGGLTPEEIEIVDPASAVAPKAMADGAREASPFAEASLYAKPLRRDKSVNKTQGKGETA